MNEQQTLKLWEHRFTKVLVAERDAIRFYKRLLSRHSHVLRGTTIKKMIRKIIQDEARHAAMAEKLLVIVRARAGNRDGND